MAGRRYKCFDLPPRMYRKNNAFYYVYRDIYNKQKWVALGSDYHEALIKYAEIDKQYRSNNEISTRGTFGALMALYVTEIAPAQGNYKQLCYFQKKLDPIFGFMNPDNITHYDIAEFLDKSKGKVTANRQVSFMSAIFSFGIRRGKCATNPCKGVKKNKEKARERYVADGELLKAREIADKFGYKKFRIMWDIGYLTGQRRGDVAKILKARPAIITGAKVAYLGDGYLYIEQSKTGKRQRFIIEGELEIAINEALELSDPASEHLFSGKKGLPYSSSGLDTMFQRIKAKCQAAGIETFQFKDLRAKAATDDEKEAQYRLGHEDFNTTKRYIRSRKIDEVKPISRGILLEDKKNNVRS